MAVTQMLLPDRLEVADIAARWKCTVSAVHKLIKRNPKKLRPDWEGNKVYVRTRDILAWEDDKAAQARSRRPKIAPSTQTAQSGHPGAKEEPFSRGPLPGGNLAIDATSLARLEIPVPAGKDVEVSVDRQDGFLIITIMCFSSAGPLPWFRRAPSNR
jgi:hypothetical protein